MWRLFSWLILASISSKFGLSKSMNLYTLVNSRLPSIAFFCSTAIHTKCAELIKYLHNNVICCCRQQSCQGNVSSFYYAKFILFIKISCLSFAQLLRILP